MLILVCYRFYNRACPLLSYIFYMGYKVGLMNNVIGKPAIFLCGRYVASVCHYIKYIDTYTNRFLTYERQLIKNSGINF